MIPPIHLFWSDVQNDSAYPLKLGGYTESFRLIDS
jgi:hypothetical protein